MSDEQTQATDDPSGPGWRDVTTGGVTQDGDMVRCDGQWCEARLGETVTDGDIVRRRIEQQQPSDSEQVNAELQQLRKQVQTLHNLAEMSRRQVADEAGKVEQLKQQLHESQRTAQRYRNQLEGAWEHAPKGPRNFRERMVLEKFRAFVEAKDDDPLTFGYVQLRATDPKVLGCSEFVVESWHEDVGGGRLSECVRVFLRHYASEEDQESRKEISARTYFHVKTVGDYERLLSLLGIGGQTE